MLYNYVVMHGFFFLSPKGGHSENEEFEEKLENNLEKAVKGPTPQELLFTFIATK